MRRRDLMITGLAAALLPRGLDAQERMPLVAAIIGAPGPQDPVAIAWASAVRDGLREEGWVEGQNFVFEVRFTAGEPALTAAYTAEMLALRPDVFVTGTTENALAAHNAAPTTPLVFVAVPDPIAVGLVASFARPGGHATGVTHLEPSVGGVMVDLLFRLAPETSTIAFLTNPDTSQSPSLMRPYVAQAAAVRGVPVLDLLVRQVEEIGPAIESFASAPGVGLVLPPNNWVHNNGPWFVEAINRHRLPAVYPAHRMVEAGGIIGIGVDIIAGFRIAGQYAGRILGGMSPADLAVQASAFSTVMNLRTVAAYGITVPVNLLATIDRFIE